MKHKTPNVAVMRALQPNSQSAEAGKFEYAHLDQTTSEHREYEYQRLNNFWEAEVGSIEESEAARQAALQYTLMGSVALQGAVSLESKKLWSDRYTQANGEIYGLPDADEALDLENGLGSIEDFEETAKIFETYMNETYGPVFSAVEAKIAGVEELAPEQVAQAFEAGLEVLMNDYDLDWIDWTIFRDPNKFSPSVNGARKIITIGMARTAIPAEQVPAMFIHEVIIHAQRSLNGAQLDNQLKLGLPGYLDAEEGLAVFSEYAISGAVPTRVIDRYTDIAYALGQIDGRPHNRAEMLERVIARAEQRNQGALDQLMMEEAHAHVERIYKGSLGDENIGVFTKDVAYYNGFLQVGSYIKGQLEAGYSIDTVMTFLLQGKFDPTNQAHLDYIKKL